MTCSVAAARRRRGWLAMAAGPLIAPAAAFALANPYHTPQIIRESVRGSERGRG